jgi:membrane protein
VARLKALQELWQKLWQELWEKVWLDRVSRTLPARVLLRFLADDGPDHAIVIAWNALFSIFPIALALAAIASVVLGRFGLRGHSAVELVVAIIPDDLNAQQQALDAVDGIQRRTGVFAIVALIGFLWASSGLFGAMEQAFDHAFRCPRRPFLSQKLMSLAMMAIFSVLALCAIGTAALLPLLRSVPFVPIELQRGVEAVVLQIPVGVLSGFVLFFVIYLVVPNRRLVPRQVWPGALLAGVAFEALGYVFPVYLSLNRGINAYGRNFALLFVLLLFFYMLGIITVVGAELNAVLLSSRGLRSEVRRG